MPTMYHHGQSRDKHQEKDREKKACDPVQLWINFSSLPIIICVIIQIVFIDRLHVDKPLTITAHPDPEQRTFWYSTRCNDSSLDQRLMYSAICQRLDFTDGCIGNMFAAGGSLYNFLIFYGVVAAIICIKGYAFFCCKNYSYGEGRPICPTLGGPLMILSQALMACISVILCFKFAGMAPMEQCNPLPKQLYYDYYKGNVALSHYSDGCVWNIVSWIDIEWVQTTVLPRCSNVRLDLDTDKYQPKLFIMPEASPLVKATIASTVDKLTVLMLVALSCAIVTALLTIYRRFGCFDFFGCLGRCVGSYCGCGCRCCCCGCRACYDQYMCRRCGKVDMQDLEPGNAFLTKECASKAACLYPSYGSVQPSAPEKI